MKLESKYSFQKTAPAEHFYNYVEEVFPLPQEITWAELLMFLGGLYIILCNHLKKPIKSNDGKCYDGKKGDEVTCRVG